MFRWLRRYFIPHPGNFHQPHFLRRKNIGVLLGLLASAELLFLIQAYGLLPQGKFMAAILPSVLVGESNGKRSGETLPELLVNPLLEEAATRKAEDMAQKSYFAHTSPEGITPWHWFEEVGYAYAYAGENLAVNFTDSKDVVEAWMNSPTHRANILNKKFTEIGIGIAEGEYKGRKAIFIAQLFGRPAPALSSEGVRVGLGSGVGLETMPPLRNIKTPIESASQATTSSRVLVPELRPQGQEVAVRGVESEVEIVTLGAPESAQASFLSQVWSNPYRRTQGAVGLIGALTLIALFLKIFIQIERQHPRLILSGVLVLVIAASILIVNQNIALGEARVF